MRTKYILALFLCATFLGTFMSEAGVSTACWATNCTSYNAMRQCRNSQNHPSWMAMLQANPNCGQTYASKCTDRNLRGESYSGCKHGDDALALCAMANLVTPQELLEQNPNCAQYYHGKWKFEQSMKDVFKRSKNTVVDQNSDDVKPDMNFPQDPF